jgi:hypothetical protein
MADVAGGKVADVVVVAVAVLMFFQYNQLRNRWNKLN